MGVSEEQNLKGSLKRKEQAPETPERWVGGLPAYFCGLVP